ncbi:aldehyde dehydrogenase family protein [Alkanindiges sp. WGS2144]|uniref:aldehyde dehydrogenase family protein n=1 Tax=Alkanindiges sp. WGS2144 TaxID=3366808 RepID=UPI003753AF40
MRDITQPKPQYPLYLANKAVETGQWLEVTDKFSGKVVSQVAQADEKFLDQAIEAAVNAEAAMAALKPYQKQQILLHCVERFKQRSEELAHILVVEGGKPIAAAKAEVLRLISTFQLAADAVTQMDQGVVMPLAVTKAAAQYRGMTQRVPVGAVSLISPFNFPLNLTAHKIAPAIVAGCPFVLKPASLTPISAIIIGEVLAETDLPMGAFSIMPCHRDAADIMVTDDRFKLLSFTGSDQVGWDMKARSGRKKVVLELGGNAAVMLEDDANVDAALDRLIAGSFGQAGQVCISVQRILVHEKIYAELKQKFVARVQQLKAANPALDDTVVGPMIKEKEAIRLKQWIDTAVEQGAKRLTGGELNGVMLEATVLENVHPQTDIYQHEAFGPVVILEPYAEFEAGLQRINDSRFGLQAGIYTNDLNKMFKAWDSLQVGGVIINDVPTFRVDNMPYGGVKDSGLGREGIHAAVLDMTEERVLVIRQA